MGDFIIGILAGIAIRPMIVDILAYLIKKINQWYIGIGKSVPSRSEYHNFNTSLDHEMIDWDIDMTQAEEDFKKPPKKIWCSVCGKKILPDEFKRKEIYSSYMPEGMGLPHYYFHKRCRNSKVILYENPPDNEN